MSKFRIGQQVSWDDYLWDVAVPMASVDHRDESRFTCLYDPISGEYHWAPNDEIEDI